jgi:hypothetical protein
MITMRQIRPMNRRQGLLTCGAAATPAAAARRTAPL